MDIRPYESKDHTPVVALWNEVFPDDPPWNEPASMIRRKLTVQPELFLVAHVNDQVAGTVLGLTASEGGFTILPCMTPIGVKALRVC